MIEIKIGQKQETKILLFRSAEELPVRRYSKFQKYLLLESGVGSDIDAIGKHFSRLFEYQSFKMIDEATTEAKNLYYTLFSMLTEINVPGLAFSCLVHSINGEEVADLSEDNLQLTVDRLSNLGLTQAEVLNWIGDVKKKSILN